MFPLNSNLPYIKDDGTRDKLGNVIGSGGGDPYTPDYEHDRLIIGVHGDYNYYIPMSKEYVGDGNLGYNIKTKSAGGSDASIYVYKIIVNDGVVKDSELVKTLVYNGGETYNDENITVEYDNEWKATLKVPMKNVSNDESVVSPVEWFYNTEVDYKWYMPE